MDDSHVRQIIREEIMRYNQQARFNLNVNPRQVHNGRDNAEISMVNISPGGATTGSVTFSEQGRAYTFNTNFTPRQIIFAGNSYHTSGGSKDVHTISYGTAFLGQNLYLQPLSNSSVQTGGLPSQIVQGCTSLYASSVPTFASVASSEHIIDVIDSSATIVARATVTGYGANSFTITVDTLASDWTILGNYFIS